MYTKLSLRCKTPTREHGNKHQAFISYKTHESVFDRATTKSIYCQHLVAYYDKQGVLGIYSDPDHYGTDNHGNQNTKISGNIMIYTEF